MNTEHRKKAKIAVIINNLIGNLTIQEGYQVSLGWINPAEIPMTNRATEKVSIWNLGKALQGGWVIIKRENSQWTIRIVILRLFKTIKTKKIHMTVIPLLVVLKRLITWWRHKFPKRIIRLNTWKL